MQLYAVQDPNWGDPVFVPETVARSEEGAWVKYEKSNLSVHADMGRAHLVRQGFQVHAIRIVSDDIEEPS